jgi:hypothetical protein
MASFVFNKYLDRRRFVGRLATCGGLLIRLPLVDRLFRGHYTRLYRCLNIDRKSTFRRFKGSLQWTPLTKGSGELFFLAV